VKSDWKVLNVKAIRYFIVEKRLDINNYSAIGSIILKDSATVVYMVTMITTVGQYQLLQVEDREERWLH